MGWAGGATHGPAVAQAGRVRVVALLLRARKRWQWRRFHHTRESYLDRWARRQRKVKGTLRRSDGTMNCK